MFAKGFSLKKLVVNPMRVAFITHYTEFYGANRSLLNLIDGLKKYGVSAYVVSPREGELTKVLRNRGVPVAIIPIRWWMSKPPSSNGHLKLIGQYIRWRRNVLKRLYENLLVLPALVRQLRAWKIDVIYTNSSVIPIGAIASKWLRLPHIWHLREFGKLHYGLQHDWGTIVFKRVIGSADALIAISEAIRAHLLSGMSNQRIHVIYNGVASEADFDRLYDLVQAQPNRQQPYTFALVGLIHPNKGQETAIRALAVAARQYPDIRLLIVGGGDVDQLKQLANESGIEDKVEFWGYVQEPYTAYLAADAVLMCSKYEAMGRVTVEAMSARRPVIGYDDGGTSEIIEHEHTGLLYRGGPEMLAACMMRFTENPEWACKLGENGWHDARSKFSTEAYAESIYRVLRSILI